MATSETRPLHERITEERDAGKLQEPGQPVAPGLDYGAMLKVWELPIYGCYGYNADEHAYWDEETQKLYVRPYSREHEDDAASQDRYSRSFDNAEEYARHVRYSHFGPTPLHLFDWRRGQREEFDRSALNEAMPAWLRGWMQEQQAKYAESQRPPWEQK